MKDFFTFRLMITAGLIKVIYPLGVIAIIAGLFVVPKQGSNPASASTMSWDHLLLIAIIANIGWRILCEQMILLFSIHESLNRKSDSKG